jgi:glycosyltransferase involved in cell wall biosynthesis
MIPPKISVVIPSFNKVRFVGETLNSIIDQKYPNLEVIIQDGGSNDGTAEIIKEFAKRYPNCIRWESKKDKGQLDAINIGLDKATGEILTFINADDVYESGALDTIAKAYIENPDALWFAGRGKVIDSDSREAAKAVTCYKNLCLFLNRKSLLLILNYLMQPSVFFTKQAYKKYGPFTGTGNFVMEYELWLKLGAVSMPIVIGNNLSCFRLSGDNISSTSFKNTLKEDFRIVKKYTGNPIILFMHELNNWGRVLMINLLKR